MSKLITVFGATGNQGGSVIRHILGHPQLSKTYKIRAITRDVSKASATALKDQGAEVVAADMNDKQSVNKAISGSNIVFGVTNFWETMDPQVEIRQGKTIVDAAKEANVDRLIWSSLPNVSKETNGAITTVKHFDGKAAVEEYARSSGVPGTYFMPSVFASGMLDSFRKNEQGEYALALPFSSTTKVPLIDIAEDAGLFVTAILLKLDETLNKRVAASGGYFSGQQIVDDFIQATGKKANFVSLDYETWGSFLPEGIRHEMVGNFKLIEDPGYYAGEAKDAVDQGHQLVASADLRKPVQWRDFVSKTFKD